MGKPRMIILIRHAQSEGNKNREIHQTIPDHRVNLTAEGHRQAQEAGANLRSLLRPDDTIHFFTSPYRRTRETTEGILQSLTSDSPSPSPFPRHTIKVYEEPRLREQDFGNFQPCGAEMERMWLERADYGHFFYRIPNGESAADAYDRVSGFNESLWRLFGEDDFASVCVLVTHGLMTRVFLMKWYHWSVEYFEDLRNINHCEFVIMKLNPDNGKYVLQNQLRTWSELRREKEQERHRERANKAIGPPPASLAPPSDPPIPIRRKWGGCPDGCNHGVRRKGSLRSSRADHSRHTHDAHHQHKKANEINCGNTTQESNNEHQEPARTTTIKTTTQHGQQQMLTAPEPALGDRSRESKPLDRTIPSPLPQYNFRSLDATVTTSLAQTSVPINDEPNKSNNNKEETNPRNPAHPTSAASPIPSPIPKRPDLRNFHRDSEDHLLHPPRSNYALYHLGGRDGGGSLSGANSLAPSEDERDDNKPPRSTNLRPALLHQQHQTKSSQDLGNDGDDEGSGRSKLRRSRSSNHHHHHHHHHTRHPQPQSQAGRRNLAQKVANIPTDQERTDNEADSQDLSHEVQPEPTHQQEQQQQQHDVENDDSGLDSALEAERREDQSIRGSVY